MMKKLFLEGYSKNAIAEAFECLPETVTARIKRAEEDTNGNLYCFKIRIMYYVR